MVQGSSQNKIKGCLIFEVSYFAFSQIWLNLPMDDHHFGYITKFDKKKDNWTYLKPDEESRPWGDLVSAYNFYHGENQCCVCQV